mmetsp:Transcript_37157/g.97429  ORF Transcript_37157/g.97429 Transcript_37157/m.97429 type:complete len:214 (-) Transcript_37157:890-1531(-)
MCCMLCCSIPYLPSCVTQTGAPSLQTRTRRSVVAEDIVCPARGAELRLWLNARAALTAPKIRFYLDHFVTPAVGAPAHLGQNAARARLAPQYSVAQPPWRASFRLARRLDGSLSLIHHGKFGRKVQLVELRINQCSPICSAGDVVQGYREGNVKKPIARGSNVARCNGHAILIPHIISWPWPPGLTAHNNRLSGPRWQIVRCQWRKRLKGGID